MNQLSIDFIHTRHRRTDVQTSRDAARAAVSSKAQTQRESLLALLQDLGPMTGKELAPVSGMTFLEVSRRMSEIPGIARTGKRRDGSFEWAVSGGCYFVECGDRDRLVIEATKV